MTTQNSQGDHPQHTYPPPQGEFVGATGAMTRRVEAMLAEAVALCDVADAADGPVGNWPDDWAQRAVSLVRRMAMYADVLKEAPTILGLPVVESPALNSIGPIVVGEWCQRSRGCLKPDGHEGDCWPFAAPYTPSSAEATG